MAACAGEPDGLMTSEMKKEKLKMKKERMKNR
jgi:hypothetical protein